LPSPFGERELVFLALKQNNHLAHVFMTLSVQTHLPIYACLKCVLICLLLHAQQASAQNVRVTIRAVEVWGTYDANNENEDYRFRFRINSGSVLPGCLAVNNISHDTWIDNSDYMLISGSSMAFNQNITIELEAWEEDRGEDCEYNSGGTNPDNGHIGMRTGQVGAPGGSAFFNLYDLAPGVNADNIITISYYGTNFFGISYVAYQVRYLVTYIPAVPSAPIVQVNNPAPVDVSGAICNNPTVTLTSSTVIKSDFLEDVTYQYYYNLNNATTTVYSPNPDYCDGPLCTGGGGGEVPMEAAMFSGDFEMSQIEIALPPGDGGPPPPCCFEPQYIGSEVTQWLPLPNGTLPGAFVDDLRGLPGTTSKSTGGNIKFRAVVHINGSVSGQSANSTTVYFHPQPPEVVHPTTGNLCSSAPLEFSVPIGYTSYQWKYKLASDKVENLASFTSASAAITGVNVGADLNVSFLVGVQTGPCTSDFVGPYIFYPPAPEIASVSSETPSCPGTGDGSIVITHASIHPGFEYIYNISSTVSICGQPPLGIQNTNARKTPAPGELVVQIQNTDLLDTSITFGPGSYQIVVESSDADEDGVSCPSEPFQICIDPPHPIVVSATDLTPTLCEGSTDGTALFSIEHGTGPFAWYIPGTAKSSVLLAGVRLFAVGGLAAGNYTVRVIDINCSAPYPADGSPPKFYTDYDFNIGSGDPITTGLVSTPTSPSCLNNGVIDVSATLVANRTYDFTLFTSEGEEVENVSYAVTGNTCHITEIPPGTFYVTAEADGGWRGVCQAESDNFLPLIAPTKLTALHSPVNPTCSNSSDGRINITNITKPEGQDIRYVYTLTRPGFSMSIETPVQVASDHTISTSLAAGTYNLTITDQCISGNNTIVIPNINLIQPAAIAISAQDDVPLVCYEDLTNVNLSVTGGTANYTLNIIRIVDPLPGNPLPGYPHTSETADNIELSNLQVGSYQVIATENCAVAGVTDATDTEDFALTVPATSSIGTNISLPRKDNNNDGAFTALDHHLTCNTSQDGRIDVTISGGDPFAGAVPYTLQLLDNVDAVTTAYESITNNSNSFSIHGLAAGTYSVRVTDHNNCVRAFPAGTLTAPGPLSIEVPNIITSFANLQIYNGQLYAQCKGDDDGTFSTTATGGNAPYNIHVFKRASPADEWSGDSFASVLQSNGAGAFNTLGVGFYQVRVNDLKNCLYSMRAFTILESTDTLNITGIVPEVFAHGANTVCFDDNTGSAQVTIAGGVGEYTYRLLADNVPTAQITRSETSHTFPALMALRADGDTIQYRVTLEDEIGCTRQLNETVLQNFQLNPPAPVAFSWMIITKTFQNVEIPCRGDHATLRFTSSGGMYPHYITVGGVTKPINNPGDHVDFDLLAGSYQAEFEDALHCTANPQPILLRQPESHVALTIGEITPPVCIGGDDNGSVQLIGINGTQNSIGEEYSFIVKDATAQPYDQDTLKGESVIFLRPANNFQTKDYMAMVVDAFGCTHEQPFTMTVNLNPLTLMNTELVRPSCFGATDGGISIEASNYDFRNGNSLLFRLSGGHLGNTIFEQEASGSIHTFTNLLSTDGLEPYRVWVEDANVCTDTASQFLNTLTLESYPALNLELVTAIRPSCFNGADGSLLIEASGGLPPYQYSRDGNTFYDLPGNRIFIDNLQAGEYAFYLRDANFVDDQSTCLFTTSFVVSPGRFVRLNAVSENVTCNGEDDGGIDLTVSVDNRNPGEPLDQNRLSIYWTNDNVSSLPLSTSEDLANVSAGAFTAHVAYDVDSLVCMQAKSVIVTQPAQAFSIVEVKTFETTCGTRSDGKAVVTVSGGWANLPSHYRLNDGPWMEFQSTSVVLQGLGSGTYQLVAAQNGFECSDTIVFEITSATISIDVNEIFQPSCPQQSDGIIVIAGNDLMEYSRDGNSFQSLPVFLGLNAGNYQFIARHKNDITCVSESVDVSLVDPVDCIDNPLQLTVLSTLPATCSTANDGEAVVAASGGVAPYTYYWDDNAEAGSPNRSQLSPGQHRVRVFDALQIMRELFLEVGTRPLMTVEILTSMSSCSSACDGAAVALMSGGSEKYDVSWSAVGETGVEPVETLGLLNMNGLCHSTYNVSMVDSKNSSCQLQGQFEIGHYPDLQITLLSSALPSCPGSADGGITTEVSGGSGSYTLEWSNGGVGLGLTGIVAGDFTLSVTDQEFGCSADQTFSLEDPQSILVSAEATPPSCHGGSNGSILLTLSNVKNPLITWSNGKLGASVSALEAGDYQYSVTDNKGCSIEGTVTVNDRDLLVVNEEKRNPLCHSACDGSVLLDVQGGTAPYVINWAHGPKAKSVSNVCAGSYSYVVKDRFNCVVSKSLSLVAPEPIAINVGELRNASCFGRFDGLIDIQSSGGTGVHQYVWSNGSGSSKISGLVAGTYNVTVTDVQQCSANRAFTIQQPSLLLVTKEEIIPPSCYSSTDGRINITPAGGTSPYRYQWADNVATQNRDQLSGGAYTVTVEDFKGCKISRPYTLTPPSLLSIASTKRQDPSCTGYQDGTLEITPTGGATPYHFQWSHGPLQNRITSLKAGDYTIKVTDKNHCEINKTVSLTEPAMSPIEGLPSSTTICRGSMAHFELAGDWQMYQWKDPAGKISTTPSYQSGSHGRHTVTAWDSRNCPATAEFLVNVSDNPLRPDFLRLSEAFVYEPVVFVDISVPVPTRVEWLIPEGEDIVVNNRAGSVIELVFTRAGTFEIGLNGFLDQCRAEARKVVHVADERSSENGRGTDTNEAPIDVRMYPNPVKGILNIHISTTTREQVTLRLFSSLDNRLIYSEVAEGLLQYLVTVDVGSVVNGVYYLIYEQSGKRYSKRVVIMN
jgi:hypothetical protein